MAWRTCSAVAGTTPSSAGNAKRAERRSELAMARPCLRVREPRSIESDSLKEFVSAENWCYFRDFRYRLISSRPRCRLLWGAKRTSRQPQPASLVNEHALIVYWSFIG